MNYTQSDVVANRDDPIPVVKIDGDNTNEGDSKHASSKGFREASGSSSTSLQERLFSTYDSSSDAAKIEKFLTIRPACCSKSCQVHMARKSLNVPTDDLVNTWKGLASAWDECLKTFDPSIRGPFYNLLCHHPTSRLLTLELGLEWYLYSKTD